MTSVTLDFSSVKDWASFHVLFATTFDFPDYYGKNMNAWIDSFGDAAFAAKGGLFLHLEGAKEFKARCPEILEALNECSAFLNFRHYKVGQPPLVALAYHS